MIKYAQKLLVLSIAGFLLVSCGNARYPNTIPSPVGDNVTVTAAAVDPFATEAAGTITAPVLGSALLGYEAAKQDGRFGTVDGFLLDAFSGRVHSLLITTVGTNPQRSLLLPWGTFSIITDQPGEAPKQDPGVPAGTSAGTLAPAPQVWLEVSSADLNGAPAANPQDLKDPGKLQQGWDRDLQAYWAGRVQQPVPTGAAPTAGTPPGESALPAESAQPADQPAAYVLVQEKSPLALDVDNPDGKRIGIVHDLIISQNGGHFGLAEFAILVPEPALELKQGRIPVTWKALAWSAETQSFVLNVQESVVAQAPGFTSDTVPDMTLPGWDAPWRDFWNNPPGGVAAGMGSAAEGGSPAGSNSTPSAAEQTPIRATTLLGLPLVDRQGDRIGKIVDWTMDVQGRSNFALVITENGGRILPLPWLAIDRSQAGQPVVVVDRAVVDKAPASASPAELDADPGWRNQAFAYWQNYVQFPANTSQRSEEENALFLRLLQVLGGGVADASKATLGSLGDVILFPDGTIAYLVLHSGAILRPIPWMDFSYNFKTHTLSYIDDPIRLENAPGFARLEEIDEARPGWDDAIRAHWGMR